MNIQGIDISYFQGIVDWSAVKDFGIRFAMLRAGYGEGNVDKQFHRNASECNRLGIPFGVYWFSYAYTREGARREAEYCIDTIKNYKVQYPVAYDFESASIDYARRHGVTVTSVLATELVNAFCKRVEELGYFSMYYSNYDLLKRMFSNELRENYSLWYARYADAPGTDHMGMWQFSDNGRVAGISGSVDLDIAYYDFADVISKAGLNHLEGDAATPKPQGTKPTVITYTVRPGDSLSRIAARYGISYQRLASYNNIQNPNRIYPGQVIQIPVEGNKTDGQLYTVRAGDTLSGIAARFGTTVQELMRINGIQNANRIYVGQVIKIYS